MTTETDQQNPATVVPVESMLVPETPTVEPAKVEPLKVADASSEAVGYEPTGDVGLDLALEFVGKAGISSQHPAMLAAAQGDFTLLKATLAQKGTVGWEQMVALGEAAYTRTQEADKAKAAELQKTVHDIAGGAEEWGTIQKWAGANATPEEKKQINGLLSQGGVAAKSAVNYLIAAYNRASNVERTPVDGSANASRDGGVGASNGPLGPKEYSLAVAQLNTKLGGRLEGSKEYTDLQRRRAAHRG